MHTIRVSIAALIALMLICTGCSGLRLNLVNASVQDPSNVAVYFTLDTKKGDPIPGITADQFSIYEDGNLISTYESKQTILNPEVATVRYTLLLLDMSGSVVESGQVPLVQEAVNAFLTNVGEQEKVAIYAFDGRENILPIAKFDSHSQKLSVRTGRLDNWKTKDPSTNLNGAIIEAVKVIQDAREKSEVPLRFGNLVIFTDGTDRAHRATSSDALSSVNEADVGIFVIGLGGEIDQDEMQRLGRDGYVHVSDKDAVVQGFQQVAERIKKLAARYYLLSYCSPSRAGVHELTVKASIGEERGRLSYQFDATNFEPNCDPNTPPDFDVPGSVSKKKKTKKKKNKKKAALSSKPTSENKTTTASQSEELTAPPIGY